MNHSFKSFGENITCAQCGRDKVSHSDTAQCESCPNIGPCEVIDDILMCALCQARDKEIKVEVGSIPGDNRVSELVNRLSKEIPVDRRAYFVGRITAIVDIEKELLAAGLNEQDARYKLAQIVEENLATLKERITGLHTQIREMQGESVADQRYLNQIVPQLRAEEREKFKAYDINYKPSTVSTTATVSKPRMSATDKAYEGMAKMLGISVEAYKKSLENAMKNATGAVCSCKETPGICKVHPK